MNASRRVVRLRVRAGSRAAAAAAGLALALAGCTATNPQLTATPYDAADGRSGQIGGTDANSGIQLRNFLIVSTAAGSPGRVVGAISNRSGAPAKVQLAVVITGSDGQPQSLGQTVVAVSPGEFVQLGSPAPGTVTPVAAAGSIGTAPATDFVLQTVPVPPGSVLQMVAGTAGSGSTSLDIPVIPAVGQYQELAPSASPSAQPSAVTPTGPLSPSVGASGAAGQSPGATPGQAPSPS